MSKRVNNLIVILTVITVTGVIIASVAFPDLTQMLTSPTRFSIDQRMENASSVVVCVSPPSSPRSFHELSGDNLAEFAAILRRQTQIDLSRQAFSYEMFVYFFDDNGACFSQIVIRPNVAIDSKPFLDLMSDFVRTRGGLLSEERLDEIESGQFPRREIELSPTGK